MLYFSISVFCGPPSMRSCLRMDCICAATPSSDLAYPHLSSSSFAPTASIPVAIEARMMASSDGVQARGMSLLHCDACITQTIPSVRILLLRCDVVVLGQLSP